MFTETRTRSLRDRVLRSSLVDLLTGPHGVDRYTELVTPTWTLGEARAKVVAARRQTPRSVTLTLEPNHVFAGFRSGQHINLTVEIDGRRRTRCYSPASAEGSALIELTVGRHDGGLVSNYLCDHARPGMIVGLDSVGGDFTLPAARPRRILFVSGGSGITPVLSMLRTLRGEGPGPEVAFIHYARSAAEACYRDELAAMRGVRVLHGYTRDTTGTDLYGRFCAEHLDAALPGADAVFVCGPPALVDAVREVRPDALAESFVPPTFSGAASGGQVSFADSGVAVTDDGRPLLEQAESAGLAPESGCRMGICHSCTRRKTSGVVKNLITGAVSGVDEEDVQICVTAPLGDVEIAL
ncbi:ferredoxin reductase [Mycolicibacterium litorale]|uniref:Oxidoreductase n=1 Tax=Mycolicibacterium litorale TaxID=758802 RepID=A0AAD1IK93_9MYCO|nr:ferredoxin reductase [Mycolicibacterium litorale]MCV7416115.1 ferredoxin reductase [Mycolicibacterium litorale]TDY09366.1 ferredoxin-NADP reductase [Mycolicibacterium litorale]BBY17312.1 oxidoreductase [Mycolicibacterium litorale]